MYNGIYKNNGIKSFAAMWRDSEIIILNEVSHTEQYKYITYMWNLKKGYKCICFDAILSNHPTLSFPNCVHNLFSVSVSLLLPQKEDHQNYVSRFYMYVLIDNICLSDLTSLSIIGSKFIHFIRTDSNVPLFIAE